MGLMLLMKRLAGETGTGGLFAYLARRNENETRIQLEKTRQATAKDLISNLRDGAVLRESTSDGWRLEIWMPPQQVAPLLILETGSRQPEQDPSKPTEFSAQHPKALEQDDAATAKERPQEETCAE
jgi:hypothetical protein